MLMTLAASLERYRFSGSGTVGLGTEAQSFALELPAPSSNHRAKLALDTVRRCSVPAAQLLREHDEVVLFSEPITELVRPLRHARRTRGSPLSDNFDGVVQILRLLSPLMQRRGSADRSGRVKRIPGT